MDFLQALNERILLFDGGTGSLLVEEGLASGEKPETWNLSHPDIIKRLHKRYLSAGADIIKTNTFGAYRHKVGEDQQALVDAALTLAEEARKECGKEAYIALDIGPCGKLLEPLGDLSFEDAVTLFKELIVIGKDRADLVLIETQNDLYELKAAVVAAKEACDLPIVAMVSIDEGGRLMTGADIETVAALLEGLGVTALGFNCGFGPTALLPHVKKLASLTSLPIVVNANAGLPEVKNGKATYSMTPELFCEEAKKLLREGLGIIGGCCGTTPEHIAKLLPIVKETPFHAPIGKNRIVVTGSNGAVALGTDTVWIADRLARTDNAAYAEALRDEDYDYLVDEAMDMEGTPAAILALSCDLDGKTGERLTCAMKALQELCRMPIMLKSDDLDALAMACRYYNGKPFVFLSAADVLCQERCLDIVKAYGGVMAISLSTKDSDFKTASEQVALAETVDTVCRRFGLLPKDRLLGLDLREETLDTVLETAALLREKGFLTVVTVKNQDSALLEAAVHAGISAIITDLDGMEDA